MRIACLSTFYPYRGGIAQFNASIFRALEKNHEVKAFNFSRQYPGILFPGKTQLVEDNATADPVPSERVLDSINPFSYWNAARKINAYQPDLLIMRYWMTFLGPALGTAARFIRKETKIISILDNVIPHEKKFFDTAFTKYFLSRNDGFIAMSDSVKNDLLKLKPDARCIRIDHPLYDHFGDPVEKTEACTRLGIDASKKNLLFFGFIRDYKGLDLLIEAFSKLDRSYNLIIAGECYGSFARYQELIDKSPLKDQIYVYTDYIPDTMVRYFFGAADVCVLPYKSATQSGITSIAYHLGVPVIATDVGGLKEIITHESTGMIVPVADSNLIADAIRKFYEKSMQARMKHDIIQLKERLSWDSFASGIINFASSLR